MNKEKEEKDNFCMACAVAPLAMAGGAAANSGSKSHKRKKLIFWISLPISIISIIIIVWYMKKCKECR